MQNRNELLWIKQIMQLYALHKIFSEIDATFSALTFVGTFCWILSETKKETWLDVWSEGRMFSVSRDCFKNAYELLSLGAQKVLIPSA